MLSCIETKDCYLHPSKCVGIFISIPLTQDPRPALEVTRGSSVALCLAFSCLVRPRNWSHTSFIVWDITSADASPDLFPDWNQSLASVTIRYELRTIWSVPHHVWHFDDVPYWIGLFVVVCFIYFIGAALAQKVELLYLPPVKWSSNPKAAEQFHYILVPLFVAKYDHVFHWMTWLGASSKAKGIHRMAFFWSN